MKKIVALLLVVVLVMASAFAFSFLSLGIETGGSFRGRCDGVYLSGDMEIIDNLDVYVRLGYSNAVNLSFGGQYKVTDFKLDGTKIDFKPGMQLGFDFGDGFFVFKALATTQFSYDTGHPRAFLRPGFGLSVLSWKTSGSSRSSDTDFEVVVETGVAYLF